MHLLCRALDISQCKDGPVLYKDAENQLRELVSGLPYLNWLDIAGTNLAGFLSPTYKSEKQSSDDSESEQVSHTDDLCSSNWVLCVAFCFQQLPGVDFGYK